MAEEKPTIAQTDKSLVRPSSQPLSLTEFILSSDEYDKNGYDKVTGAERGRLESVNLNRNVTARYAACQALTNTLQLTWAAASRILWLASLVQRCSRTSRTSPMRLAWPSISP